MIKQIWDKISVNILQHKIASIILAVVILGAGYYAYGKLTGNGSGVQYVLAAVQKGTLVSSISGSGQVSSSNLLDLKAKASGDVIYIGVKAGQYIGGGTLIAQIDSRDAEKTVRDAKLNLESAQLNYDKIAGSISGIRGSKEKNQQGLSETYDSGFNAITNSFANLPDIMTMLNDALTSRDYDQSQWNMDYYADAVRLYDKNISIIRNDSYDKYLAARKAYDQNLVDYKSISRSSDATKIETIINQTYETNRLVSEAIKSAASLIQVYKDKITEAGYKPKALADTQLLNLNNSVSKINSQIQSLYSAKNAIQDGKEALISTDFDIRSQEIQLNKAKDALLDAQQKLSDYYIRAPFSGIVAMINVKVGDSSSASSIATMITNQKIAEISLNEVDVAKVKIGQKATLTFDAVSDLTITGKVAEIDILGSVTQGVVTYNVKIAFDTQDEKIKPGMTVSAAIITDTKQDVLLVPNAAVKSQGGNYYVEILNSADSSMTASISQNQNVTSTISPTTQSVQIGASNDSMTEISGGLKEGDSIIARTITASTATQTQQNSSSFRIPGMGGGR